MSVDKLKVVSLFSGCGGLDLGFTNSGFEIIFANDNDKSLIETYEKNHGLKLDIRSLEVVSSNEIPNADGILGGPPCQSWSIAGKMRGVNDKRGKLFYEYIRVLADKKPKFFVAENVPGILSKTHIIEFKKILSMFEKLNYNVSYKEMDSRNFGIPQSRKRVIIVGYNKDYLNHNFIFPNPTHSKNKHKPIADKYPVTEKWLTLRDAIGDLPEAVPAKEKNHSNGKLSYPNHEYMIGGFSSHYLSRNRIRNWDEQSFTIQAGGRHAPLHPNSSKMIKVEKDKFIFEGANPTYRRLSVRECARIQTFPDDFIFYYRNVADGYKMVGNAVPIKLAEAIANKILSDLKEKA